MQGNKKYLFGLMTIQDSRVIYILFIVRFELGRKTLTDIFIIYKWRGLAKRVLKYFRFLQEFSLLKDVLPWGWGHEAAQQ